ncbi:hypothetical protein BMW26_07855 [Microbacterium sp. 1.5R]|uniref:hypothetical protein n=1 Tax=Microbacterium sp. 1.5R TaxID=1916917 RepID=UPI00090CBDC5|nr:hypothetical protein [Microbacterium sp. 1.5R]APH44880.1 hypothetical protein BMW26_07855 [Microbacterium sp. 1.5R]
MGFFNTIGHALWGTPLKVQALPTQLASPWAEPNNLMPAIVGELWDFPVELVTPEIALRVPEVNRALQAHQALVAPLKMSVYVDGEEAAEQPYWVSNTDSGIPRYICWTGTVKDLFLHGAAVLGAELDSFGSTVRDFIHVPAEHWEIDRETGRVVISDVIPAIYRQHAIYIPLGSNGLLVDGIDSVRQARKLELARQKRIDTPPAATELHITDVKYDEMTSEEREALAKSYAANRNKHAVAVTPSYMQVIDHNGQTVDLFENAKNSLRLELAQHAGLPASFLEAGKEGGSSGQMSYTNENGKASELWVFGSSRFAYAILARLSLDDVVGPNAEVRADLSDFMVPTPDQLSAESPVTAEAPEPPATEE